jgi:hypothetical protein
VASAFLPLTFPLLGDTSGALAGDIHIDNHVAFVVHADAASGEILGAAAYPVRDRFQLVGEGGTVNFHGPVRWFARHTFVPLSGSLQQQRGSGGADGRVSVALLVFACVFTASVVALLFVLLYRGALKPGLVRRLAQKARRD